MRYVAALTVMVLGLVVIGCKSGLPPNALEEGRSCILGIVPPSQVEQVQVWAPSAQVHDYLLNPSCDEAEMTRSLNEIRRDTR